MTELEFLLLALCLAAVVVPVSVAWWAADDEPGAAFEPDLRLLAALNRARQPGRPAAATDGSWQSG